MNRYYLMAQLPSLDGIGEHMPLPITEERLMELCTRFLSKKAVRTMRQLTLAPPKGKATTDSSLVNAWNENERLLRYALALTRAAKMNKAFEREEIPTIPSQLMQIAQTAVEMEDPMAAERFLHQCRLAFLEALRPLDVFAEDTVFYYGLKLKLLHRMKSFDEEKGRPAYQNLYQSTLRGQQQEAHE